MRGGFDYRAGRALSGTVVKFKRKGGFRSGITLGEAMSDAHLSSNDYYSLYDLNADARGRIILKIRVRVLPFFSRRPGFTDGRHSGPGTAR